MNSPYGWIVLALAGWWVAFVISDSMHSKALAAPAPPLYDFDFAKKDREIDWCVAHHGLPAMTFTRARSNVLCLKPDAVIALPEETRP